VQPFEHEGWLYVGRPGGEFLPPRACGVFGTKGGGRADVGDLDGDGWLDVVVAGIGGLRIFQNERDGTFEETMAVSGEVSYKAMPFASGCTVGDFNNDARADIVLTYWREPLLVYFNRGFRSFGLSGDLAMMLNEMLGAGQQGGMLADIDDDGDHDLILVQRDGTVWCAYNGKIEDGEALSASVSLAAGCGFTGPVRVQATKGERPLGAWQTSLGQRPVFVGVEEPGPLELEWRLPGGRVASREVVVEDRPVRIRVGEPPAAR
jgi:hypothetical protein